MKKITTLVTGGTRSGKSSFAEKLAAASGKKVIYIATATVEDEEMARRVENHRARRPPDWKTVEEPLEVAGVVAGYSSPDNLILIDCLALYLSNLLLKTGNAEENRILASIRNLCETITHSSSDVIIVTNEVGWGLVPTHPLGRVYRDLLGTANQLMASAADRVYLVVCGLAVEIKSLAMKNL